MFKRYSEKQVKALVQRLKEEYSAAVARQQEICRELKEENRILRSRLSVLEGQRGEVSEALMRAVAEGERIKNDSVKEAAEESKELELLAEKCRILCTRLLEKYPDEEDCADFKVFTDSLYARLGMEGGEEEEDTGFRMEDVLDPKQPLDLEELCRGLDLMGDDEE